MHAGDAGPAYLKLLNGSRCFRIESFDERAAIELAAMTHDAIAAGDLRAGSVILASGTDGLHEDGP